MQRQNCYYFAEDIQKFIFLLNNLVYFVTDLLKYIPNGPINT